MIYVVLGMHKSGTTLVSETLHRSGINMGEFEEAVGYDQGNKYERKETLELNMKMLGCTYEDVSYDVVRPVSVGELRPGLHKRMRELIEDLNHRYQDWGFKDPRTCLTYPVWRSLLPEHRLIAVYRHPLEVWRHYLRRIPHYRLTQRLNSSWKALKAWYIYNSQVLKHLLDFTGESIALEFGNFMSSQRTFYDFENFLGRKLSDCRKPSLYRERREQSFLYQFIRLINSVVFSRDVDKLYSVLGSIEALKGQRRSKLS